VSPWAFPRGARLPGLKKLTSTKRREEFSTKKTWLKIQRVSILEVSETLESDLDGMVVGGEKVSEDHGMPGMQDRQESTHAHKNKMLHSMLHDTHLPFQWLEKITHNLNTHLSKSTSLASSSM
jgi:hypothetical protein